MGLSHFLIIFSNGSIPSVYTEGTIVGKERIKKAKKYDDV
jgi:hypothetical protein